MLIGSEPTLIAAYARAAGSVGKRLAWWHNHIWSREETWSRAAVIWISLCGNDTISVNDYDRCVTHLANTFETDGDFDYQVVSHRTGFEPRDISHL